MNFHTSLRPVSRVTGVLAAAGLAFALGIALFGDRALASITTPASKPFGDRDSYVRATPSPDGSWIAIDHWSHSPDESRLALVETTTGVVRTVQAPHPVEAWIAIPWSADGLLRVRSGANDAQVQGLDPRTLESVRSTSLGELHEQGLAQRRGDGWSQREIVTTAGERPTLRISWQERGLEASFELGADASVQTTSAPGVVFQSRRGSAEAVISRHELDGTATSELAHVAQNTFWRVSPDGERLQVSDKHEVQVLDARSGQAVATLPGAAYGFWIGTGSRWIATCQGRTLVLHDLERQTSRRLFEEAGRWRIEVLDDERVLAQRDEVIFLFEKDSATPRQIYPPAAANG